MSDIDKESNIISPICRIPILKIPTLVPRVCTKYLLKTTPPINRRIVARTKLINPITPASYMNILETSMPREQIPRSITSSCFLNLIIKIIKFIKNKVAKTTKNNVDNVNI